MTLKYVCTYYIGTVINGDLDVHGHGGVANSNRRKAISLQTTLDWQMPQKSCSPDFC